MESSPAFDTVIVGAGIAGLYAAYTILKRSPTARVVVLEKSPHIGGRVGVSRFAGIDVLTGAGVGRKGRDIVLETLLRELGIEYATHKVESSYASYIDMSPDTIDRSLRILRKAFLDDPKTSRKKTFRRFAIDVLGSAEYARFVTATGYTDFDNMDVHDALYDYHFQYTQPGWQAMYIPWKQLIRALVEKIGRRRIRTRVNVTSIVPGRVRSAEGRVYLANTIVCATTAESLRRFFPRNMLYRQIHGQPFMRTYVKFSKDTAALVQSRITKTLIVGEPLAKIIPIRPDKGIYMLAYADNDMALALRKRGDDTDYYAREAEKAVGLPTQSLTISKIQTHFWDTGTHYYDPLPCQYADRKAFIREAQRPSQGIIVVGEAVSVQQGWVEGALESVHTMNLSLV